jgi:hypothetical protein
LFFTTDDERKVRVIEAARGYDRERSDPSVRIAVAIGPLMAALRRRARDYDVIGMSMANSPISIRGDGRLVAQFMAAPDRRLPSMMDPIPGRFARDGALGTFFLTIQICRTDDNQEIAERWRRGWGDAAAATILDFPIGTTFWARTQALRPLLALTDWSDYPTEPVPIDGTILHALERLLPFAARQAGYRYATTHVPGVTR